MARVQVLHTLASLAGAGMVSVQEISQIESRPTFREHGIAELMHSKILEVAGALKIASALGPMAQSAHIQPQMLLSLAWPRYLQELAASKTPITQVGSALLSSSLCKLDILPCS